MTRLPRVLFAPLLLTGAVVAVAAPAPAAAADCEPLSQEGELDHTPWGQARLAPERAWPLSRGKGVTVAVIDSGVSDAHPTLDGKVSYGDDYTDQYGIQYENDPQRADCDLVGHGTAVAGIVAGREDADSPFSGVAPAAEVFAVRVLRDGARTSDEELPAVIGAAIREAVDAGAQVLNLSLQTHSTSALESAVEYAQEQDVVVVAAAGNQGGEGGDVPQYPAAYDLPAVLAAAATDVDGAPANSSNSGDYVDVAAPGVEVVGPGPEGEGFTGDSTSSGTSFAAAFVSGAAALVRARFPDLSAEAVADRLRATAQHPPGGWNPDVGYGMLDVYRAVSDRLGEPEPPPGAELGPRLHLSADVQAAPRRYAGAFLGGAIALAISAAFGAVSLPKALRKRRERLAARRAG